MAAASAENTVVQEIFQSAPWRRARREIHTDVPSAQDEAGAQKCIDSSVKSIDSPATAEQGESEAMVGQQAFKDLNDDGKYSTGDSSEKSTNSEVASDADEIEKGSDRSANEERSTDPEDDDVASCCLSYCETMSNWSEHDEIDQRYDLHDVSEEDVLPSVEQVVQNFTNSMGGEASTRWADMDEEDDLFFMGNQGLIKEPKFEAPASCAPAADAQVGVTRTPLRAPPRTPLKKGASLFVPIARPAEEYHALPFLPSTAVADAWQRWHDAQESYGYNSEAYHYANDSYHY